MQNLETLSRAATLRDMVCRALGGLASPSLIPDAAWIEIAEAITPAPDARIPAVVAAARDMLSAAHASADCHATLTAVQAVASRAAASAAEADDLALRTAHALANLVGYDFSRNDAVPPA